MNVIHEGDELRGESGKTYLAVSPLGQANVWTAVDTADNGIVVLKSPAADDTGASWPHFQHEMIMHELLKDCTSVRKQVDRIPPVPSAGTPPILVLEMFETTLWGARTKRPFTKEEVRSVARQIMQGLKDIHDRGLVYADLKMQNVMLSGFDVGEPGDLTNLVAKLGDLGIVMYPTHGTVQPVAYRAPEVFFKGAITPAADIWGFGLIYCHLLEAIERFDKTGIYDDLYAGSGSMPERVQAMRHALGNDYDLQNVEYYKECALPYRASNHPAGNHWEELRKRGLDEEDVEFLQWILKSDPRRRPSAQAILNSDMMNPEIDGAGHGHGHGHGHGDGNENGHAHRQTGDGTTDPPSGTPDAIARAQPPANGSAAADHGPTNAHPSSHTALPPQPFPLNEPTHSLDPVKRQRRDDAAADGPGPETRPSDPLPSRPDARACGASQAGGVVFTPGVGTPDNPDTGYLLWHKSDARESPILAHPLVVSARAYSPGAEGRGGMDTGAGAEVEQSAGSHGAVSGGVSRGAGTEGGPLFAPGKRLTDTEMEMEMGQPPSRAAAPASGGGGLDTVTGAPDAEGHLWHHTARVPGAASHDADAPLFAPGKRLVATADAAGATAAETEHTAESESESEPATEPAPAIETAPANGGAAKPARPALLGHIGKQSSTGGTWLSYQ
ncbi:hypothetical protein LTR53_012735 [Teratosphaeriaceae sp. CCFEE 6253]|nr:hypothetical protein LTR53_012735 [Teratosphaeriaceae sp. CCFEE 6253]